MVALAWLEIHYMRHAGFLRADQLLRDIAAIRHLPAAVVQGCHDVVCPIHTAERLVRSWPGAAFAVIPDAGHSAFEPGIHAAAPQRDATTAPFTL